MKHVILFILGICVTPVVQAQEVVIIDGEVISAEEITMFEQLTGIKLKPGHYTTDPYTGALKSSSGTTIYIDEQDDMGSAATAVTPQSNTMKNTMQNTMQNQQGLMLNQPNVERAQKKFNQALVELQSGGSPILTYQCNLGGMPGTLSIQYTLSKSVSIDTTQISGTRARTSLISIPSEYHLTMGAEVRSQTAYYMITAEGGPNSAYGNALDVYQNQRFRIEFRHTATGVWLISNPFEGLYGGANGSAQYLCTL